MTRAVGAVLVISWVLLGLPEVTALDLWVQSRVPRPEWLRTASTFFGYVFGPVVASAFGVGLAVIAYRKKDARLWRGLVLFGLCWGTLLSRYLFRRVRPVDYPQWAYPSGHTVAVAAVGFTLVVLLGRGATIAVTATVLTAASRVVLERHWVTDVIGSVLGVVGVGLLAALALGLVTSGRDVVPHFRRSGPGS
ncbi:phosphatase PAP2 family protein [Lentzea tibetensis]|uniref:Phosphatase PAP2 family protein n=1 Tax=Lentzea tibetensis TaxID=2591470 RepID=A0A563EP53_9PSEU|nr:phosphatase PAP2 family protein [Lentzea tibetensis]TWP48878.1 phosphatase PAP2 family protein [Lentzea tibetensis]